MPTISVQITRFISDHFPGFVECKFVDAFGKSHTFIEKAPVLSADDLSAASRYPCHGEIQCEIDTEWQNDAGLFLVKVCTERPWGIESTGGEVYFIVFSSQITNR